VELQLEDKTAIVTGASRGIGRAIVERLIEEGARVVAAARTFDAELTGHEAVTALELDLGEPWAAERLAAQVREVGGADVLVNNLGRFEARLEGSPAVTDEQWQRTLELNLLSAVRVTRAVAPLLRAGGAIVNVSSINAQVPQPMVADYAAAKAALTNFSRLLAEELGERRIRVNTVSPGPTLTPAWDGGEFGRTVASAAGVDVAQLIEQVPKQRGITLGRLVEPDEVAAVAVFLASERASGVTGADYRVDGGLAKAA
jgi:putative oxidoreductase